MRRILWGSFYCLIGAGGISSIALLSRSIVTGREPIGLAGVSLGIATLFCVRVVQDARWLKGARAKIDAAWDGVYEGKMAIQAKAALIENDIHRATRELEAAQAEGLAQLAAEREEMLAEVEAKKNQYKTEGLTVGIDLGRRGIAAQDNANGATVIRLPVGQPRSTTMGQGALYN